ncbi:MAG: hypothetical protein QOE89_2294 [Pseudonocardiales bacterium]|nr:hypothetical protein [Pseudonocardiales bacterium]
MVHDTDRDRAIYQALKAVDEVAAALQTNLIEEHPADPERGATRAVVNDSCLPGSHRGRIDDDVIQVATGVTIERAATGHEDEPW